MFAIEKGIPAPGPRAKPARYPFGELEIEDSFYVPADNIRTIPRVRAAASMYAKQHGLKFVTAVEGIGIRVWRIA